MGFKRKRLGFKDGDRIRMKESPCGGCCMWGQKYIKKGDVGKIVRWNEETYSYSVAYDRAPQDEPGMCGRHFEAV